MNAERLLAHYERIADAPDAIARLRRFVLDLAVRGKLVPQDPNDEPASELLKRIAAEKARLVKAGEIRNRTREHPDLMEPPFDLPENWTWVSFGEIHHLIRGVTYSKSDVSEVPSAGFVPVLRANNIGTTLTHDEPVHVKQSCVSADQFLRSGDFMIALSSGSKNLVGKAAFVPEDYREAFGGFCGVIRLFDQFLQGMVRVFLHSGLYRESISEGSRGIGINNLKQETLANLFFPLPPLAEQHRIVAKVDELMTLCDRLEAARKEREATRDKLTAASLSRLNAPDLESFRNYARFALDALPALTARPDQIKPLRQTILNLAVRGKLVPQDASDEPASELLNRIGAMRAANGKRHKQLPEINPDDLGELPLGWFAVPLIALGDWAIGSGFPKNEQGATDGLYFFLKVSDMNLPANAKFITTANNFIDDAAAKRMRAAIHPPGTIIFPKIGGAIATNKRRILTRGSAIDNNCLGISFSAAIDNEWAYLLLTTLDFTLYQAGTAVPALQQGSLSAIPVALPPLAEQHRIVAKVDELMTLCDRLEASLATADETRRRLLEALLAEALASDGERKLEAAE